MARRRGRFFTFLTGGAAGAVVAYFMDPDRGRGRRIKTKDQLGAVVRRGGRRLGRAGRATGGEVYGAVQRVTHPSGGQRDLDDQTLKAKVETELFGDPDVPKGKININVEEGVVVLRGQVDREEQVLQLEEATRQIPGVTDVRNLLGVSEGPTLP